MNRSQSLADVLRLVSTLVSMNLDIESGLGNDPKFDRDLATAAAALRRAVARGGRRRTDRLSRPEDGRAGRPSLTPRERQVVKLLLLGFSYKEIAVELQITFSTAQSRVKGIYGKLGVHSKTELASISESATEFAPGR
ncbi:MAG: helix-turn-helix transcriptional regulator [Deltaproteobacteria bacterium]|nr:helix-turn-helix transcriptional regulator [Deltaproteobacteria bacterium]